MQKKFLHGCLVGLGAAVIALALWLTGMLDRWEYITWTFRVRFFAAREQPSNQVKIILIDQNSLDWGKNEMALSWPWPRQVYGPIIDFCKRAGVKALAFDMLFTEPSLIGADQDEALGAGIRRSVPFVGAVFLGTKSGEATRWPAQTPDRGVPFTGLDEWLRHCRMRDVVMTKAAFPIPEVATNAAMLANVSDQPDNDGLFRRATLFRVFDGRAVPTIGLAAYLAAEKSTGRPVSLALTDGWLDVNGKKMPIDDSGRAILYFRGRRGTHESYSAAAVINSELRLEEGKKPELDPSVFTNAYVLFGTSAPGLLDLRPAPISKVYPGVEIHATSLDNLLSLNFLRDAPRWLASVIVVLLALAGGLLIVFSRKASQNVVVFVVLLPVPLILGFAGYALGFWWPVMVGESAVALAMVGGVVVNYATEGRQKAFIKSAFKYYLGPDVIDQIISDPSQLKLGGEKRELTIYFSDIEKFSSFSERLESPVLTALLNDYLTEMGAIIQDEGGYLDKFIGDAIVAFWNAPLAQADHAVRACRAALRCQRKLAERREELEQKYGARIKARIGINTGAVNVGNMGSRERFNYTVLGDAANLASRLEGANKAFGTYAMISEETWSKTDGQFVGRELGQLRVVGREKPVRVYEIMGFAGEALPSYVPEYARALKLCAAGKWSDALRIFEHHPEDPPSAAYVAKCRMLLSDLSQKWDGIWSLTEK